MPLPSDLPLLQDLKFWIYGAGVGQNPWLNSAGADGILNSYISDASRAIMAKISRGNLLSHTITEMRDGVGSSTLMLRDYPVTSISALYVDGLLIPPRPPLNNSTVVVPQPTNPFGNTPGYVLAPWDGSTPGAPQQLAVIGSKFWRGFSNIQITYQAGYLTQGEAQVVPAPATTSALTVSVTPLQPLGRFAGDAGVTYANGTPLTAVTGTPAIGQYNVPAAPPASVATPQALYTPSYTFASADAGASILLNYSFVPHDLAQACTKWIGEWYSYRQRIGMKSMAMPSGQGTASFDLTSMPDDVMEMVENYRRRITV